jgi:hypothetical protein
MNQFTKKLIQANEENAKNSDGLNQDYGPI